MADCSLWLDNITTDFCYFIGFTEQKERQTQFSQNMADREPTEWRVPAWVRAPGERAHATASLVLHIVQIVVFF